MESIPARKIQLDQWLQTICTHTPLSLQPLAGDASFRRYYRLNSPAQPSCIVMDAPPAQEKCEPFIAVANALRALGLNTPTIFAADTAQGFLLLSDFGDATFLRAVTQENADLLYTRALQALANMQVCKETPGHPLLPFDRTWMMNEWEWHQTWFLTQYLGVSYVPAAVTDCYRHIVEVALTQPQTFMHRDYHSANLMVLPDNELGILDFQDAFIGPLTYDLASLLRDAYIDWPAERVNAWLRTYWEIIQKQPTMPACSLQELTYWFDLMGIQRHLKAIMTFARKYLRDKQPGYLQHIPRTLNYILQVSARYPELAALHAYYTDTVLPKVQPEAIKHAK